MESFFILHMEGEEPEDIQTTNEDCIKYCGADKKHCEDKTK